jgi:hypothetical protein
METWTKISDDTQSGRRGYVLAKCRCGRVKEVYWNNVLSRKSNSCGCGGRNNRLTHGASISSDPFIQKAYHAWFAMKGRCGNPRNHKWLMYGGVGITVSSEWINSFESFLDHLGPPPSLKHSIDRIDGSRGYEPGNCRWATCLEQSRNRKCLATLTVGGITKLAVEWCREHGVSSKLFHHRKKNGWSPEKAATTRPNPAGIRF